MTNNEAVEMDVVRCKECRFNRIDIEDHYHYCALENRPNRQWSIGDNDYCSWGERREEGKE